MMKRKANFAGFILALLDPEYNVGTQTDIEVVLNDPTSLKFLLRTALNNRILYAFCRMLMNKDPSIATGNPFFADLLSRILSQGEKRMARLRSTLELVHQILELTNTKALFIKTLRYPQGVTFDVDVLLRKKTDFKKIKSMLQESFSVKKVKGGYEMLPKTDEHLIVDLYYNFIKFGGIQILNPDYLWADVRSEDYSQNEYLVPGPEGEILLHLSQVVFQNRFLTLSDFIHLVKVIRTNIKNIHWNDILTEANHYRWQKDLTKLISMINGTHACFYGEELDIPIEPNNKACLDFPIFLNPAPLLKFRNEWQGIRGVRHFLLRDCWAYINGLIKYNFFGRIPIYRDWIDLSQ